MNDKTILLEGIQLWKEFGDTGQEPTKPDFETGRLFKLCNNCGKPGVEIAFLRLMYQGKARWQGLKLVIDNEE